jgi:hypothetical protein
MIEEHNDACFIVKDANGQALSYFYFEEEPGRRSAAKLLTKDEALRLAVNFAIYLSCCRQTPVMTEHLHTSGPAALGTLVCTTAQPFIPSSATICLLWYDKIGPSPERPA